MNIKKEECASSMQLVWAKLKYCSYWPAKITEVPPALGKLPGKKVCVLFFGTKNYGFVPKENIADYIQHREKYVKKGKGKEFFDAVQQMDDFIRDPNTYSTYGLVKTVNSELFVKQEREAIVKTENEIDENLFVTEAVPCLSVGSQIDQLKSDKTKIIQELVGIKDENQKLHFEIQQKIDELQKLNTQRLIDDRSAKQKIQLLERELNEWKQKYAIEVENQNKNDAMISKLNRENFVMMAKLQQLQQSMNDTAASHNFNGKNKPIDNKIKQQTEEEENESDSEFEVESLRDHKMVKGKRLFLVRWKNFSSKYDTWESEKNLHCPKILEQYLKSKKIKK